MPKNYNSNALPVITISNISKPSSNAILARILIALEAAGLNPVIEKNQEANIEMYMRVTKGNPGPLPDFMEKVFVEIQNYG